MEIIIIIIKPYLSAHTQLSPYAQQIQTTIYNEKQYEHMVIVTLHLHTSVAQFGSILS